MWAQLIANETAEIESAKKRIAESKTKLDSLVKNVPLPPDEEVLRAMSSQLLESLKVQDLNQRSWHLVGIYDEIRNYNCSISNYLEYKQNREKSLIALPKDIKLWEDFIEAKLKLIEFFKEQSVKNP